MTFATILPLALFVLVSSITPGPNNVMLTASGATFGYLRSMPHMLGITLGVVVMLLLVGAGLGTLFDTYPTFYTVLKYVGAAYLLYLAWRIARAGTAEKGRARARPMRFLEAAAFQWVNPKAWLMAVGIVATYTPRDGYVLNLVVAAMVCGLVNFPSISVWTLFGAGLARVIKDPIAMHRFNVCMALLLVASLYPLVVDRWQ